MSQNSKFNLSFVKNREQGGEGAPWRIGCPASEIFRAVGFMTQLTSIPQGSLSGESAQRTWPVLNLLCVLNFYQIALCWSIFLSV